MKETQKLKPNYGPAYAAAMYPGLVEIFHRHGFALAVHGSLARDLDLIAVPWREEVSDAATVLKEVTTIYALRVIGEPERKYHGRIAYTLSCGFGECAIDLSFIMTKFEEYRLIFSQELDTLNKKVTTLLAEGWQLYGNPFGRESPHEGFVQAMFKPARRGSVRRTQKRASEAACPSSKAYLKKKMGRPPKARDKVRR